ncbi:MAG TPA: MotA/TolQ/ExbB proton channel family protein, partial [Salinivirgaceae bacterium]|nr:MotA/TolQ/ExbB proton channel family protein [Salinivirgaceae bacterium]
MINTLIQDVPSAVAESQATEMTMSIWEMTLKGGVLMIPIFILSIIAVYIFFERYFAIRNAS